VWIRFQLSVGVQVMSSLRPASSLPLVTPASLSARLQCGVRLLSDFGWRFMLMLLVDYCRVKSGLFLSYRIKKLEVFWS
jgi:hypothetical protein